MKVIPIALLLSLIGCIVAETEIFSIQWEPNKIGGTNRWEPVFPNDRPLPEGSVFSKPAQQMETIFVDEIGPNKTIVQEADKNHSGINVTFLDLNPDQYRKVLELLPVQPNLVTHQWTASAADMPTGRLQSRRGAIHSGSTAEEGGGEAAEKAAKEAAEKADLKKEEVPMVESADSESTQEAPEKAARELNWKKAFDEVDRVMGISGCGASLRKLVDSGTGEIKRDDLIRGLNKEAYCGKFLTNTQITDLVKNHMTNINQPLWISAEELMSIHAAWKSMEMKEE